MLPGEQRSIELQKQVIAEDVALDDPKQALDEITEAAKVAEEQATGARSTTARLYCSCKTGAPTPSPCYT